MSYITYFVLSTVIFGITTGEDYLLKKTPKKVAQHSVDSAIEDVKLVFCTHKEGKGDCDFYIKL